MVSLAACRRERRSSHVSQSLVRVLFTAGARCKCDNSVAYFGSLLSAVDGRSIIGKMTGYDMQTVKKARHQITTFTHWADLRSCMGGSSFHGHEMICLPVVPVNYSFNRMTRSGTKGRSLCIGNGNERDLHDLFIRDSQDGSGLAFMVEMECCPTGS